MNIRKATIEDVEAINKIYNQAVAMKFCTAHLEPVGYEERVAWFFNHDPEQYPLFIIENGEELTGWLSLSPYREKREALSHVAEISYYVHNDFKGQGVGSRLMGFALKQAPEYGFSTLIAILLSRNPASIALLNKFGFEEWGSMPGIARIGDADADHLYYGLKLDSFIQ
jgi:L-amino acid N-acyltransferase YncA